MSWPGRTRLALFPVERWTTGLSGQNKNVKTLFFSDQTYSGQKSSTGPPLRCLQWACWWPGRRQTSHRPAGGAWRWWGCWRCCRQRWSKHNKLSNSDLISPASLISVYCHLLLHQIKLSERQISMISSTQQTIISLSHLFWFRSWKIFFIVFTRNCC